MPWLQTYTGKKFHPLNPDPELIDIEDIAHSLANQCRFNGHVGDFYSVAEHSVLVSMNCPEGMQLTGLLHDAAEAYIGDMIRPLKPVFPFFDAVEDLLILCIMEKFGGIYPIPDEVKHIDNQMVLTEGRRLMTDISEWGIPAEPLDVDLVLAPPVMAKDMFLDRFMELAHPEQYFFGAS